MRPELTIGPMELKVGPCFPSYAKGDHYNYERISPVNYYPVLRDQNNIKVDLVNLHRLSISNFFIQIFYNMAPLQVIGAGYGRTGTDSLREALNILG